MPHIGVTPLLELCLTSVTEALQTGIKHHREELECKICAISHNVSKCPDMKTLKKALELPPTILTNIFKQISITTIHWKPEYLDNLNIFCFLLECPELTLDFHMDYSEDIYIFLQTYGKHVKKLGSNHQPNNSQILNDFDLWKRIFLGTSNLQILRLHVGVTDELLEAIGKHCNQIKHTDDFTFYTNVITTMGVRKLCFYDYSNNKVKNKCCETLEYFGMEYFQFLCESKEGADFFNDIATFLIENLVNLKSIGFLFHVDLFLQLRNYETIPQTNLEEISAEKGRKGILPKFKAFCPKMKSLDVENKFCNGFSNLFKFFPYMEQIRIQNADPNDTQLYSTITSFVWSKLVNLSMVFSGKDIELAHFAKSLPVLEELEITDCGKIKSSGVANFKHLHSAIFQVMVTSDFSWISALSNTVKKLSVSKSFKSPNISFDKSMCSAILTVPFPKLEELTIYPMDYDFDFITSVITTCNSLINFRFCNDANSNDRFNQLKQFIKENNYKCGLWY